MISVWSCHRGFLSVSTFKGGSVMVLSLLNRVNFIGNHFFGEVELRDFAQGHRQQVLIEASLLIWQQLFAAELLQKFCLVLDQSRKHSLDATLSFGAVRGNTLVPVVC